MRRPAASLLCAFVFAASGPSHADPTAEAARRASVVARVGSVVITLGELEDRLNQLPTFQRRTFGANSREAARRFLDDVFVRDTLLSLGAEEKKLASQPDTAMALDRARSNATLRAVRAKIGPAASVSPDDVRAYYEANKSRYDQPERYQIWRILCKTEAEAKDLLDKARKDGTPKAFTDLAREHSLDKATYLRGGNLGFIAPDGTSSEPRFRVDPAIPKAAAQVADGEFVPRPIAEGENFAVIWRRGTLAAAHRSMNDAAAQIRDTLWRDRIEAAERKLIDELYAAKVTNVHEDILDSLTLPSDTEDAAPRKPTGSAARP